MLPVTVELVGGGFRASVFGNPTVSADGATRDEAIGRLRTDLRGRADRGELVWVDVPTAVPGDFAGRYTAEEADLARQMVADIYRERDEQKAREFPE